MSHDAEVPLQNNPCPRCGGDRVALESKCQTCQWQPGAIRLPPAEQVVVTLQMLTAAARTTSISSMLLLTAIVAACVAAGTQYLALGILASVISFLAAARTSLYVLYSKAAGEQIGLGRKVESFSGNVVLISLFLSAAAICFFPTSFLITIATQNFILGFLTALLLSFTIFLWLLSLVPAYPR